MRILTDDNGVAVNAISSLSDGTKVAGHYYQVLAGLTAVDIKFQRGAVLANGVNGITSEALLAIVLHRTKFLDGEFPCVENTAAIAGVEAALAAFDNRTAARKARGVEGKEVL